MLKEKKPVIISEDNPFVLGKLTLYPNRLKYKDAKCNFKDIVHVGWYFLSQTINFINVKKVHLSIYIRDRERPIEIRNSTMYVTPKLITAYHFIAKATFDNRIQQYIDQLEEYGGFNYRDATIYSDGRVLWNNKVFYLHNAQFEPFKIIIKQGGMFSPKMQLDITLDQDILLVLINYILKNPEDPEKIRDSAIKRKEVAESIGGLIYDVVCLLAKISSADGKISPEEISVIKDFLLKELGLEEDSFQWAVSIFNNAKTSPEPFELYAKKVKTRVGQDTDLLRNIADLLFFVATADKHISAEEELLLKEAEIIFGVEGSSYANFKENFNKKHHIWTEKEFLEILGLSQDAQPSDIKLTYRRLAMQYHPDHLQHLGPEFQEMAEEKMKEINKAYTYFQQKYQI